MKARLLLALAVAATVVTYFGVRGGSSGAADSEVRTCTELGSGGEKGTVKLGCKWPKHTLKVRFLGGDRSVQQRVEKHAKAWMDHCSVKFVFGEAADADIRISFDPNTGSWSYIGKCQSDVPAAKATMNFGWLTPDTDEAEYQRVVLHEFGHALGLVHEHQNPIAGIPWNKKAVYAYYLRTQGWNEKQTDDNVLTRYTESETSHNAYDPGSIMEYPIPKELLTKDGSEVGWNRELSASDKEFIKTVYPGG